MNSHRAEYDVQPSYNESLLPICPPSYSEAVAPSFRGGPSTYQLPNLKQPGPSVIPQAPQVQVVPCQTLVAQPSTSTYLTLPVAVGPKRAILKCPHCLAIVQTNITTGVKRSAHYCCCFLFFCGCFLCSWLPYCLASFKDVHHTCPQCKGFIGTYRA